jgi:DNA-binding winged helix-turn-helix (wHTH) protein/TolB-like protein
MNEPVSYEFAEFLVDTMQRQLRRGDSVVPLTSKAFETLFVLIQHRGEIISKHDLMDAVWGDTAVEENNLTQQISALRKAFGERPNEHRYIITLPGRGYSFVAPMNESRVPRQQTSLAGSFWKSSAAVRTAAFAAVVLVIAFVVALSLNLKRSLMRPIPQTIAVLPFRSADGSDDEMGAGMRYTLTAKLGNLQEILNVRGAVSDNFNGPRDPIVAGREMNVDAVLNGTIQHDGEKVRVTVQMLDVAGGRVIWAKTVDAVSGGSFAVQDRVTAEIINGLKEFYARD